MPIPMKRVVLSTSALAVVAGPSIVAAHAATRQGHTSVKTSGVDSTPDNEHDTRSASLWFSRAIDAHRGQRAAGVDDNGGKTPETEHHGVTTSTGASGSGGDSRGSDGDNHGSSTTYDDPTTVTTRSPSGGPTVTTRATTTTTSGSLPTTRGTTSTTRRTSTTGPLVTTRPTTTTSRATTTTSRPTTTTTAAGATTTTRATTTTTRATTTSTTTTTTRAAATIRLSQSFLATAIANPIQLSTSISNDAATPASITLTINLTTTGNLPGYLYPLSKPTYLSCSPSEIQNPSPTGTFTCTGSVPAATTGAVVVSSGSVIIGTAGTPVNATATAGGVSTSAASTYN
jgi:hypothetical protein